MNTCDPDGSLHFKIKLVVLVPDSKVDGLYTTAKDAFQTFSKDATKKFKVSFENLLKHADSTDVLIVCSDNVKLEAHKLVLSGITF